MSIVDLVSDRGVGGKVSCGGLIVCVETKHTFFRRVPDNGLQFGLRGINFGDGRLGVGC